MFTNYFSKVILWWTDYDLLWHRSWFKKL